MAINSILVFNGDGINYLKVENMYIQLKPEHEQFIQAQMASGRYENADDVIAKALKLLEEWEKGYQEWEEETRKKIAIGLAQVERGEVVDGEVVMARLTEKIRKARDSQG